MLQTQPQTSHLPTSSSAGEPPILQAVPPDYLEVVLPMVEGHLRKIVAESNGGYSMDSMLRKFASKEWILWVVWSGKVDAIVGTELYAEPSGLRACMIRFCTGENANAWQHLLSDIEDWARENGCVKVDMIARKGWAKRLPDYKMTHVLLEKAL